MVLLYSVFTVVIKTIIQYNANAWLWRKKKTLFCCTVSRVYSSHLLDKYTYCSKWEAPFRNYVKETAFLSFSYSLFLYSFILSLYLSHILLSFSLCLSPALHTACAAALVIGSLHMWNINKKMAYAFLTLCQPDVVSEEGKFSSSPGVELLCN